LCLMYCPRIDWLEERKDLSLLKLTRLHTHHLLLRWLFDHRLLK